jgi:hypothetical protein
MDMKNICTLLEYAPSTFIAKNNLVCVCVRERERERDTTTIISPDLTHCPLRSGDADQNLVLIAMTTQNYPNQALNMIACFLHVSG